MIDFRCESVGIYLNWLGDVQKELYPEHMNSTGMTGFEPGAEAGVHRTKTYRPRAKNTRKNKQTTLKMSQPAVSPAIHFLPTSPHSL